MMVMRNWSGLLASCATLALSSCVAHKAIVVTEMPDASTVASAAPKPSRGTLATRSPAAAPQPVAAAPAKPSRATAPAMPSVPARKEDLRMPDMLDLPQDQDLRTAKPPTSGSGNSVISRPPVESGR